MEKNKLKLESMLDNVKEIRFCWDLYYTVIPKEEIKLFQYNKVKESSFKYPYIDCDYVCLEINLDYLKTHYEEDGKHTLFDYIQDRTIWHIEVIKQDEEKVYLELPSYRRESYFPNNYYTSFDATNLCENHSILNDIYKMEWLKQSKKDMWMNYEELLKFFKHGILSVYFTQHEIGIELFERILQSNIKKRKLQNIDTFSILRRIRESNMRRKKVYRRKVSYKVKEEYVSTDGIERIYLNFSNHSYKWNLTFVFVNSSTYKKKLYSILKQQFLPDTSHFFHRHILVFDTGINIEEFMKDFYNSTSIPKEMLLYTTVQEVNELWYHIHEEADLW